MTETLKPPPGVYSRRTFLQIAGATTVLVSSGGLLTACGGDDESSAEVGGPFNLFQWAGYDGVDALKDLDWYAQNGLEVNLKPITTPGGIPTVIKGPGGDQWDASSANQGDSEYYQQIGISSEITTDEVPALDKMLPFFKEGSFWKISDGVYNSVPWTWGPIGFTGRPDRIPQDSITSYQDFIKPEFKNRLETFDDALNVIATGAVASGLDPSKVTREQLNGPIKDYLTKLRPNLKVLATSLGDQINNLVSGDVDGTLVGFNWAVLETAKQGTETYFLVPEKEGSYGFADAVFIPPNAPHRANALAYANAMLEGETAVTMQGYLNQLSPNPDVIEQASAELRALYPEDLDVYTGETLQWNKSYNDPDGPYATIAEWTKLWEDVKAQG